MWYYSANWRTHDECRSRRVSTKKKCHWNFMGKDQQFGKWWERTTLRWVVFQGALSSLRQFLITESPLKMMKNASYFTSKALFVLKIFKFLSWLFGQVAKRLDKKDQINFKFYDVAAWLANNCNTHITQYVEK